MLKHTFDHTRDQYYGYPLAPIELIEYGDLQCENCARVHPEIKKLQGKMGNRLKLSFAISLYRRVVPCLLMRPSPWKPQGCRKT